MQRPKPEETLAYYHRYINLVADGEILSILKANHLVTQAIIKNTPAEMENFRYAEGKWSIKEVFIHIIDTERIMAYRALRFARNDKTELQGFDENTYAPMSNAENRTLADIAAEFEVVRAATIAMFQHFTFEMMDRVGTANGGVASVRGLAYIIAGHELHHIKILNERYYS